VKIHGLCCRLIGGLKAALNTPTSLLRLPKKLPLRQEIRGPSEIEVRLDLEDIQSKRGERLV